MIHNLPPGRDSPKIKTVGKIAAIENPDRALAGDAIFPNQTGLPCAEKIGCAPDLPLHRDSRKVNAVCVNPTMQDPDPPGTGNGVFPDQAGLACAKKIGRTRDMPLRWYCR